MEFNGILLASFADYNLPVRATKEACDNTVPALKKWLEYFGAEVQLFCGSAQRVGIGQPSGKRPSGAPPWVRIENESEAPTGNAMKQFFCRDLPVILL